MTAPSSEQAARLADAQAHLASARAPAAHGPGPDVETLRRAYLDLLKLALCDLAGASTGSVGALGDGGVMARELRGEELRLRAAGMDWPLQGLTMVGLARLDDLQRCVESVVADGVEGDLIEAGAWRGGASILMRATLDTLGDERTVFVADSFQGFTHTEDPEIDLSAYDFLAVPEEEVRAAFARFGLSRGVELVPGFFADSLPALSGRRWAVVRLDGDTYEATREALAWLYPGVAPGGHVIVDDYGSFAGSRQAVDEFRAEHGIAEPMVKIDHTGARWQRTSAAAVAPPRAPAPAPSRRERPPRTPHVPTARELELARELEALRGRLARAQAQVGLRPWLRRRFGR